MVSRFVEKEGNQSLDPTRRLCLHSIGRDREDRGARRSPSRREGLGRTERSRKQEREYVGVPDMRRELGHTAPLPF